LQNNTDYGIGPANGTRNTLNIQPVIPFSLSPRWNLIGRVVLPVISQYNVTGEGTSQNGLSDALISAFFSPASSKNGFTWGFGPVFLAPTATNDFLGARTPGLGPTAIALKQIGGWTMGSLANQLWSVTGNGDQTRINQMFLQPFVVYNFKSGAGIGGNGELTFDWQNNTTVAFINPTVSAVTKLGSQTVQMAVGPRLPVAAPDNTHAAWGWRAGLVFMFPR
jgi:hypothetical protein